MQFLFVLHYGPPCLNFVYHWQILTNWLSNWVEKVEIKKMFEDVNFTATLNSLNVLIYFVT
jgi:hypothetical protein